MIAFCAQRTTQSGQRATVGACAEFPRKRRCAGVFTSLAVHSAPGCSRALQRLSRRSWIRRSRFAKCLRSWMSGSISWNPSPHGNAPMAYPLSIRFASARSSRRLLLGRNCSASLATPRVSCSHCRYVSRAKCSRPTSTNGRRLASTRNLPAISIANCDPNSTRLASACCEPSILPCPNLSASISLGAMPDGATPLRPWRR